MGSLGRSTDTPAWRRYLRFWRPNPDADVADELQFHLESAVAEYVAAGMTPEGARAEALRRFGDIVAIAATLRTLSHQRERTMAWSDRLHTVRSDLRFAHRQLRKSPVFTLVAILTLALGIGANSAIFSIVYSVLLRPLPYAHADRLLGLRERNGVEDRTGMYVTYGNYGVWKARVHSFEALAASRYDGFTLTGVGEPRSLQVLRASADYWKALYIPPALGRYYGTNEDAPGAPNVIVLSHAVWESTFGGDSSVVGRSITLSGVPYTVVGIASPGYLTLGIDGWVPLAATPAQLAEHADHELAVVGLVREGVMIDQALAELRRVEQELAAQYPHSYFDGGIIAKPLRDSIVGSVRSLLLMLLGSVALVLLIACVNIANLLLARAGVRRKEMAVRGALGAGRGRLVAQLLTESLLLSGAGAVLGVGLASFGVRFLVTHSPLGVPRLHDARVDTPVLVFTLGLAVACGIGFGLLPALRASRQDLQESLREGSRSDAAGVRGYLRSTLVVCQIAMAMVLLVGAGLLVRSAVLMQRVAPGFDTRNLLLVGVGLPSARYPNDTAVAARFNEILRSVSALPGVAHAALVSRAPIADFGADCNFRREGGPNGAPTFNANVRVATPGYFGTLRVPLLRGRDFGATDAPATPPVVVINRRLARELFESENDAIGKRITCSPTSSEHPHWSTVIGIAGDLHAGGLGDGVRDEAYGPNAQNVQRSMEIVMRGVSPVTTLAPAIRRVIGTLDPLLPVSEMRTMDDVIDESMAPPRFTSELLSFLGVLGLALAVIGIYGVIAYFVAQRTYEIGIRMALGADSSRVLGMVVWQGLALTLLGIAIGTGASLLSTSVLANLLYGVTARDPWTFATVALLLGIVAVAATIIPARRAARVDPIVALRVP